jgi:hypothetical protein
MSIGVSRLKAVGKAMGDELDHGNKLIDRIGSKVRLEQPDQLMRHKTDNCIQTDPLDDQIRVTNARMNRIH